MSSTALASSVPILIEAGTTILIPSGPIGDHLFVTVFDIKIIDGRQKALLVPFESQYSKCDKTCLLNVGEHEFIKNPTFIGYKHCRIDDVDHLIHCIDNGAFKINYAPASADLLLKIRAGYLGTRTVVRHIRKEWGY